MKFLRRLFVGVSFHPDSESLVFIRGDGKPIVVSKSRFLPSGEGLVPDFSNPRVIDYGHAVQLGSYEAAVDAILYEVDADARRRMRKTELDQDESLGGSLRRLRLQRGLKQDDFGDVPAKTIGRIERGDTKEPNLATLAAIAERLGVSVEELRTY
jgi:DNA-binding XRE family transcriptional regulator